MKENDTSIGPHEGRELELMSDGTKPLAMFVEPVPSEFECFPEDGFDALVAQGRLVKRTSVESLRGSDGVDSRIRRVLYALPAEVWRIDAVLIVQGLYDSLPGWRPDLDRIIGILLGYDREDIEKFVRKRSL